jgi:small subunit ribosomal protein S17
MDKTVVVRVERVFKHPFYKKVVKSYQKFKAHDQENKCNIGDQVIICETRPISKDKRWRVVEIVGHKKVVEKELPGPLHKKEEEEVLENKEGEAQSDPG